MGIFNESIKTIRESTSTLGGANKKGKKGKGGKQNTPGAGILRDTKIKTGLK